MVWTAEEVVSKHGSSNWTAVPKKAGLKRFGKSCRLRWANHLRPDLNNDSFTPQEEDLLVKLHAAIGSRWSIIAQQLPGKTDNDVKNHWNTKLKKKLSDMGIDPVTHKPFSKLLADYGNIGGVQKPSTRTGSLSKDFKNAILLKSNPYPIPSQGQRNMKSQTSLLPKMEPTENSFFHNKNYTDIDLAQFQVPISGEGCLPSTPSPSSSSSTYSTENLPLPFCWNDFLLEDAFPAAADNQEQETMPAFLSKDFVSQIENVIQQSENKKEVISSHQNPATDLQLSSSSEFSFLEAMLNQENDMFLNFPHLMEEPPSH
ncbi:hypothetical protein L6164_011119 [Bauhinia variegata]|uniref:Uncharacterized protein n=1 Tax=Bauhinia variegata TaxID=167791 RepID=A0ACB9P4Q7_BAUVA|nr:hypothetical protein L6164_011119 [Bauhinia variegata]